MFIIPSQITIYALTEEKINPWLEYKKKNRVNDLAFPVHKNVVCSQVLEGILHNHNTNNSKKLIDEF